MRGGNICFVSEGKQKLYEHSAGAEKKRRIKLLRVAGEEPLPGRLFYSIRLHFGVFGTFDDVVLQVAGHVAEEGAVAGDADDQVAVVAGILLGGFKRGAVDDVELQMPQLQVAPGADEVHDLVGSFLTGHGLGRKLDVQEAGRTVDHAVVLGMEVGEQVTGRALMVGAVRGGGTGGQGGAGLAAVGRGADDLAEGHMGGDGHIAHVHMDAA